MPNPLVTDNELQINENPSLVNPPADSPPPADRADVTGLDEEHLKSYIMSGFRNMISDKQDFGWTDKKLWNIQAYYQQKYEAMKHWPWEGASAFMSALTATLTDTAWANVQAGIWGHKSGIVSVPGIQNEDIRPAKILEKFLNWQVSNEIKLESQSDKHIFRTFLHGTSWTKQMFDLRSQSIKVYSLDVENCFVPIGSTGLQKDGTDILIQVIPLSYNDIQIRKAMGVYRDVGAIQPGIGVNISSTEDIVRQQMDVVSGVSMDTMARRDNYYICEVHLTYVPKDSLRPMDLIVWISPNGGVIQRIRKSDGKRPFADAHAYPYGDRYFSMSLPEKIRPEQEKYDYADKQYTDALDRANNPAAFVDDMGAFDRTRKQRVPGGIYPKGKGNTIDWEPQPPVERGIAQERTIVWEQAMQKTGIIDVMQGRNSQAKTLGEIEIKASRADVRFNSVFKRFASWGNQVISQIYELDDRYVPKSRIEEVIGYNMEGYTINELFPKKNGVLVNYNFGFAGTLLSDKQEENQQKIAWCSIQLKSPSVINDPANEWRVSRELADAMGVRNMESIVMKPKSAYIIPVYEFIQRAVSGQKDLQVRPGIDSEEYIFELQLFMKTETFQILEPYQQQLISDALRRAYLISAGERKAMMDLELAKEGAKFNAIQDEMMRAGQGMGGAKVPSMPLPPPPVQ